MRDYLEAASLEFCGDGTGFAVYIQNLLPLNNNRKRMDARVACNFPNFLEAKTNKKIYKIEIFQISEK